MQDYRAISQTLMQEQWDVLLDPNISFEVKVDLLLSHCKGCGAYAPSEPSIRKWSSILMLSHFSERQRLRLSTGDKVGWRRFVRLAWMPLVRHDQPPADYVKILPASPDDFKALHPKIWSHVFKHSALPTTCPIDVRELVAMDASNPSRGGGGGGDRHDVRPSESHSGIEWLFALLSKLGLARTDNQHYDQPQLPGMNVPSLQDYRSPIRHRASSVGPASFLSLDDAQTPQKKVTPSENNSPPAEKETPPPPDRAPKTFPNTAPLKIDLTGSGAPQVDAAVKATDGLAICAVPRVDVAAKAPPVVATVAFKETDVLMSMLEAREVENKKRKKEEAKQEKIAAKKLEVETTNGEPVKTPVGKTNVEPAGKKNVEPVGEKNVEPVGKKNVEPAGKKHVGAVAIKKKNKKKKIKLWKKIKFREKEEILTASFPIEAREEKCVEGRVDEQHFNIVGLEKLPGSKGKPTFNHEQSRCQFLGRNGFKGSKSAKFSYTKGCEDSFAKAKSLAERWLVEEIERQTVPN